MLRRFVLVLLILNSRGWGQDPSVVSVYCSLDKEFSEQILKDFEKKTGIKVRMSFDVEQDKTVGMVNKIISEKDNPRCDVYWNNEVGQTIRLKNMGLLQPYKSPNAATIPAEFKDAEGYWTGLAARARVIIYNTDSFAKDEALKEKGLPKGLADLTDRLWGGQVTIAKPLTGTTLTHFAALFAHWGEERTKKWIQDVRRNEIYWSRGNAMCMRDVGAGRLAWGYTDTDDANVSKIKGHNTKVIIPDQEEGGLGTLVIPNSVMMVKGTKNISGAKKLIDYILSPAVEKKLAEGRSAQIPLHPGIKTPAGVLRLKDIKAMPVDWEKVGAMIEKHGSYLHATFEYSKGEGKTWPWVLGTVLVAGVLVALGRKSAI